MSTTKTVHQTRRERLELLIAEHGSIASLNSAMGMRREDSTFSLIRNQSAHTGTGKPRIMGDELARKIEQTLGLQLGWMDTPVASADERIERVVQLLQGMSDPMRDQAVAVVDALAASWPKDAAAGTPADTPPAAPPIAAPPRNVAAPVPAGRAAADGPPAPKSGKPGKSGEHGNGDAHGDRHGCAKALPAS